MSILLPKLWVIWWRKGAKGLVTVLHEVYSCVSRATFLTSLNSLHVTWGIKKNEALRERKPPPCLVSGVRKNIARSETVQPILSCVQILQSSRISIHLFCYSIMLVTNTVPKNRQMNHVFKRLNASSPECFTLFFMSWRIHPEYFMKHIHSFHRKVPHRHAARLERRLFSFLSRLTYYEIFIKIGSLVFP